MAWIQQMALNGKAVCLGVSLLTSNLVLSSWRRLRESRGGRKVSWPNSALYSLTFFDVIGDGQYSVLHRTETCLEHTSGAYAQVWENKRVKTSCIVSADVIIGSNWFCFVFVILTGAVSCKVLNTFCVLSGTVFCTLYPHSLPLSTGTQEKKIVSCCLQEDFSILQYLVAGAVRHRIMSWILGPQNIPC